MEANIDVSEKTPSGGIKTRLFALATLLTVVSGVGYAGREAYRAATDSFIAPIILTPDNDIIVQSKIKLSELYVERAKSEAELEGIESNLVAGEKAIRRLKELQTRTENALVWTRRVNAGQAFAGTADLHTLAAQKSVLAAALAQQSEFSRAARADLDAGLISRADYAKELQSVGQVELALLENERTRLQSEMQMKQVILAQQSLASGGGSAPMPEMILREDQVVRVELELLKLEAEQRTKTAERGLLRDKIAKIDEISAQLKGRPIFRAVEKSMDVAFVPYTQIEGMKAGSAVYDCVWGLFSCTSVGTITEIVPGEVVLPDPWGTQTRGQYAVLDLSRHDSAKSKSLRVRLDRTPQTSAVGTPVAAK
jgi:hypothetical protein